MMQRLQRPRNAHPDFTPRQAKARQGRIDQVERLFVRSPATFLEARPRLAARPLLELNVVSQPCISPALSLIPLYVSVSRPQRPYYELRSAAVTLFGTSGPPKSGVKTSMDSTQHLRADCAVSSTFRDMASQRMSRFQPRNLHAL